MFASPAYAQAVGGDLASSLGGFVPIILIFGIMYFLMIRPQQKKMKQ
ncbi:MAG: preprotein translocase subunit YajC, partial [Alphaproteobacteria bacterium]